MRTKLLSLSALLAASMLIGGANVAQAQNFNRNRAKTVKSVTSPGVKTAMAPDIINPDKPITVTSYESNREVDTLTIYKIESFEYDENGFVSKYNNLSFPDSIFTTDLFKRDENGEIIEKFTYRSETGYDNMYNSSKELFRYDNFVKDLSIFNQYYYNVAEDLYSDPVWNKSYGDSLVIVRDSQDRIVSSDRYIWKNGYYPDRNEKCIYGEGIGPEKIETIRYWGDGTCFTVVNDSIVWKKCANQIHNTDMLQSYGQNEDYQLVSMIERNELSEETLKYVYKYDDADRLTEALVYAILGDTIQNGRLEKREYIDDNGSLKYYAYIIKDLNGDGVFDDNEMFLEYGFSNVCDDKGRDKLIESFFENRENGEMIIESQTIYEYKEDEKGRLSEVYLKDLFDGEIAYETKIVYTYDDTATGIASVNRNGMDLKVSGNVVSFGGCNGRYVVCNGDGRVVMSGSASEGWVSLENLPSGFYIVSVNGCTVKVLR